MIKLTPAQKRLVSRVQANQDKGPQHPFYNNVNGGVGVAASRNGERTARVLIEKGVMIDVTVPDCATVFVKLANTPFEKRA